MTLLHFTDKMRSVSQ